MKKIIQPIIKKTKLDRKEYFRKYWKIYYRKNRKINKKSLLNCQNEGCGHRFKKGVDWKAEMDEINKIKCPKCKRLFRGNE